MAISKEHLEELDYFKDLLPIDPHSLDEEVSRQPELYYAVAEKSAKYSGIAASAKADMKEAYAKIALEIREDSVGKTTEKLIEQQTDSSPAYTAACKKYIKAEELADAWTALTNAFVQRSHMIRELANLMIAGYYQSSTVKSSERKTDDAVYEQRRLQLSQMRANKNKIQDAT